MESRFGHDFSRVRVHTGGSAAASAQAVGALAYTYGSDVFFGVGRYSPGTYEGRSLLAHELAHVVQQQGQGTRGASADEAEREAWDLSRQVMRGEPATMTSRRPIGVACAPDDEEEVEQLPEGTHSVVKSPPGSPQKPATEAGIWAHINYEKLKGILLKSAEQLTSEQLPEGLSHEFPVPDPRVPKENWLKADRVDFKNAEVIEIKPDHLYDDGLAQAEMYAYLMNRYLERPDGKKWTARCVIYNQNKVMKFLRDMGYLEPAKPGRTVGRKVPRPSRTSTLATPPADEGTATVAPPHADKPGVVADPELTSAELTGGGRRSVRPPGAGQGMGHPDLEEMGELGEGDSGGLTGDEEMAMAEPSGVGMPGSSGGVSLLGVIVQSLLADKKAGWDAESERTSRQKISRQVEQRLKGGLLEYITWGLQGDGKIAYAHVTLERQTTQLGAGSVVTYDLTALNVTSVAHQEFEGKSSLPPGIKLMTGTDLMTDDEHYSFPLPLSWEVIKFTVAALQSQIDLLKGATSAQSQQRRAKLERCQTLLLTKGPHVLSFGSLGSEFADMLPMGKPPGR